MITDEIKKLAGVKKGAGTKEPVGNIELKKLVELAKKNMGKTRANDIKAYIRELAGTCASMGITIDGKSAKEVSRDKNLVI